MTSAHRPTFDPARGKANTAITMQTSVRDMASHTTLKFRQPGQVTEDEAARLDLRQQLLEAERAHFAQLGQKDKVLETKLQQAALLDKEEESSEEESSEEEDEDDTEELMRELEKIKRERAQEKEQAALNEQAEYEQKKQEQMMTGNPLLRLGQDDFSVKRRWDEDVVFKNQAKMDEQPKKRFVNDLLRSDFHRKFMQKYVR
jgi:protein CWC15